MRLLILCILFLLPLSALAADLAPPWYQQDSATLIHPSQGTDYYYDQHGNNTTVYRSPSNPGMSFYSSEDHNGRITSQGFLFEPSPPPKLLTVPESMRPTSPLMSPR